MFRARGSSFPPSAGSRGWSGLESLLVWLLSLLYWWVSTVLNTAACFLSYTLSIPYTSLSLLIAIRYQECFSVCTCIHLGFCITGTRDLFFSQGCALALLSAVAFGLFFTIGSIAGVIRWEWPQFWHNSTTLTGLSTAHGLILVLNYIIVQYILFGWAHQSSKEAYWSI